MSCLSALWLVFEPVVFGVAVVLLILTVLRLAETVSLRGRRPDGLYLCRCRAEPALVIAVQDGESRSWQQ